MLSLNWLNPQRASLPLLCNDGWTDHAPPEIGMNDEALIDLSEAGDSIYFNQLSFYSGKLSAGAAIETCKAVLSKKVKNAIAVIRPPGHHAEPSVPMGFCLFNNVCIASKVCQDAFSEECRKILIVDWYVVPFCGFSRSTNTFDSQGCPSW